MTAPPRKQPAPPKPRPFASTVLLYASLLVVIVALVVGWQWHQRSRAPKAAEKAAPGGERVTFEFDLSGSASQPATAPTSAPAGATRPATRADAPNISPLAVDLTEAERAALGGVRDFIHRLHETGFYLLLGRTAKMPKLSDEEYADLPRIKIANILKRPALHRAQPMRLKIRVFAVRQYEAGKEMTPHRAWPVGSRVWELHAMDDVTGDEGSHPLIVFLTTDPSEALGKPVKTTTDGEKLYHARMGKRLELAGLFYKVHMTRDRGDRNQASTLREYPVFLAWQIAAKSRLGGGGVTVLWVFLVAGLALLVGFVVLKKYLRQIRKGDQPMVRYRPLRDTLRAEAADALAAAEEGDAPEDPEPEDTEVDPLLKQAAEEYRREKRQEREQADGENGSG